MHLQQILEGGGCAVTTAAPSPAQDHRESDVQRNEQAAPAPAAPRSIHGVGFSLRDEMLCGWGEGENLRDIDDVTTTTVSLKSWRSSAYARVGQHIIHTMEG